MELSISINGIRVYGLFLNNKHASIAFSLLIILFEFINFIIFNVLNTSTPFFSENIFNLLSPVAKI